MCAITDNERNLEMSFRDQYEQEAAAFNQKLNEEVKRRSAMSTAPRESTPEALSAAPEVQAVDKALPDFDAPDVQVIYKILCRDDEPPNPEEHWEGYRARQIAAAIRAGN
jgi:hypothetical protein